MGDMQITPSESHVGVPRRNVHVGGVTVPNGVPNIASPLKSTLIQQILDETQTLKDDSIKLMDVKRDTVDEIVGEDARKEQTSPEEPSCEFGGVLGSIYGCLRQIRASMRSMDESVKRL